MLDSAEEPAEGGTMTTLNRCDDADDLANRAADFIIRTAGEAIRERGRFTLVLSGGSTPERTYRILARPVRTAALDWSRTYLFFGDERFVPPDDERSNFRMVQRSLLAGVPIPADHVFPMATAAATAEEAARDYADQLGRFFPAAAWPRFDLVLLGLGDDGHTASLFPGAAALKVADTWVTWSPPGRLPPPVDRITLTYPVLNAARQVAFLVAGANKAAVLKQVFMENADRQQFPAAGIQPADGTLTWFVDKASWA
jgi:6-phosphogluconolactonase